VANDEGSRVLINPLALFGDAQIVRNAKLLQTLTNGKWPPRNKPWWPSFCLL